MSIRHLAFAAIASTTFLAAVATAQPTYSKEVSRIFRSSCESCHRDGDIAPFSLNNYDAAVTWAADISRVLRSGLMPPWKPRQGVASYKNDYSITDDQKQVIFDWLDAGMPEGDPADLPDPMPQNGAWGLGYPDQVLTMTQAYTPPIGTDIYRCFVLDPGSSQTRYLSSIDVLPGARSIVHHVLLYAETPDATGKYPSDALDGKDGNPGYTCFGGPGFNIDATNIKALLGGWAPGTRPYFLPDGYGIEVGAKARIVMQVHYYPVGRTDTDQTQIGLYFAPKKPAKTVLEIPFIQDKFTIPPGNSSYNVTPYNISLPSFIDDVEVLWIYPHMHLLGKTTSVSLTTPDQVKQPMIAIDDWDFNYQGAYSFAQPWKVPGGSTVTLNCNFDNSANNPRNPNNPLVPVSWGERTTDEMCVAFVGLVSPKLEILLPLLFK